MFKLLAILLAAVLVVGPGCDSDEGDDQQHTETDDRHSADEEEREEPEEEIVELHPIWGDWSPGETLEALQGEWITVRGPDDEVHTRWIIDGDQAVFTERDDEAEEGTVSLPYPGALRLDRQIEGGTTGIISSFAREGDDLYVGLGMGGVILDDRMVLRTGGSFLVYHRDDETCTYHEPRGFDGFDEEGVAAACEIVEEQDKQYLVYTNPSRDREIGINQRIEIGEESLTDLQLRSSRLRPVE